MTALKICIVLIGACLLCGPCLPGTWFGRPGYYRVASTFAGWGLNSPSFATWTIEVSV